MSRPRDLVVLGSTGSIGTQALDVVRRHAGRFNVVALAAGGGRPALLAEQAVEFGVETVAVAKGRAAEDVQLALYAEAQRRDYAAGEFRLPRVLVGPEAAGAAATLPCDVVLNGITGSVGLLPTLAALDAGRTLALANKESLIVGGPLVTSRAKPGQIVPVDSEHSALAQCLRGERREDVRRLLLTASGGPFRQLNRDQLAGVTPEQALAHPTWDMGPVVTINSATLVNKGLELIEAHLLFDIPLDRIDVVVHPQSYVHSMVEFADGSTMAQVSPPDMRLPIALALSWPDRLDDVAPACDWRRPSSWDFAPLDDEAFPAVELARAAASRGGTTPAVFNAANEICVAAFLDRRVAFPGIVDTVAAVLGAHDVGSNGQAVSVEDVLDADAWARRRAAEEVAKA